MVHGPWAKKRQKGEEMMLPVVGMKTVKVMRAVKVMRVVKVMKFVRWSLEVVTSQGHWQPIAAAERHPESSGHGPLLNHGECDTIAGRC